MASHHSLISSTIKRNTSLKCLHIVTIALLAIFIAGCANSSSKASQRGGGSDIQQKERTVYRSLDDLATSKVATYTGSSQERALEKKYPKMQILRMDADLDMIESLVAGVCEAVVLDDYALKYYSKQVGGVEVIDTFGELSFGVAFKKVKTLH